MFNLTTNMGVFMSYNPSDMNLFLGPQSELYLFQTKTPLMLCSPCRVILLPLLHDPQVPGLARSCPVQEAALQKYSKLLATICPEMF